MAEPISDSIGILSVISGILSIMFGILTLIGLIGFIGVFIFVTPILGIITGILGIRWANKQKRASPCSSAKIGSLMSKIGLAISIIAIVLLFAVLFLDILTRFP